MNGQIPVRHMPHVDGLIDRGFRDGAANWLETLPEPDEREKRVDYGRPLMSCGTEEKLREVLSSMKTPTLIL